MCGHAKHYAKGMCKSCYDKQWRTPALHRKYNLRSYHGIEVSEYEARFDVQGRKCAVCGRTADPAKPHMPVDHDHKTEIIRGIICSPCNRAIGYMEDDPARLRAAAEYLEIKR